ncbi:unnamed protein product [Blepharisma stoltei]|uniref:Uncharacterized protein n=1 Tax=Blepharisma stoltei TaxID=1481888 RepID=A0AAU9KFZ2_9CILI|nr:unnamed protein product [Blepharisma stoltei]
MDTASDNYDLLLKRLNTTLSFVRGLKSFLKEASKIHSKLSQAYDANFSKIPTPPTVICQSIIEQSRAFCYTLVENSDKAVDSAKKGYSELKSLSTKIKDQISNMKQGRKTMISMSKLSFQSVSSIKCSLDLTPSMMLESRNSSKGIFETLNAIVKSLEEETNAQSRKSLKMHFKTIFNKSSTKVSVFGSADVPQSRDSYMDNCETIREFEISSIHLHDSREHNNSVVETPSGRPPTVASSPFSQIQAEIGINPTHTSRPPMPRHRKTLTNYQSQSVANRVSRSHISKNESFDSSDLGHQQLHEVSNHFHSENSIIRESSARRKAE